MESEGPLPEPGGDASQEASEAVPCDVPELAAGGAANTSLEPRLQAEEPAASEGGAASTSFEPRLQPEEPAVSEGVGSAFLEPRPQVDEPAAPEGPPPGPLSRGPPVAAGDEFEEVQDFSSEPLETRFESKDLNRRCSAYSEVAAALSKPREGASAQDEPFQLFRRHISTVLGETLPKGQDAGLNALTAYLENCPDLDQEDSAPEVLGLVRRLIEHKSVDKPKMQQLSPGIVVLVAEICQCPGTVKEITDCLVELDSSKKKTQGFLKKQIAFTIKLFYHLIAEFGLPKMSPKLGYLTLVLKYLADSDRGIREACYSVVMELSAWMGDLPDAVKSLEEPQKKELSKRLAALSEEERARTEAKRIYRCERGQTQAGGEGGVAAASAFDRAETVDALRKLPKGWCIDKVFSMEKWKDKQQHLAVLAAAVDAKRLAPGEGYAALVPALVRLLKNESNIPILMEAAKCVGLIAKGLRSEFDRPARQLLSAALTRINDKSVWKQNILIERVEQMLWAVPFEAFLEELRQYMNSKSTWTKKEAMNLLLRTLELPQVQESCPDAFQRFFPTLAALIIPAADDADNSVRHEACRFLAVLVHQNRSSPNLGPMVLEKYPMHRLSAFEEEWRKLDVAEPCPLTATVNEDRPRATSQSASTISRRGAGEGGGARSRPTSPLHARPGSPRQERRPPESPSKTRREASAKPSREAGGKTPVRSRSADNSSQLDEQSILESSIVKDMAEEIKSLRAQLQRAQETAAALASAPPPPPATTAAAAPAARTESRLRPGAGAEARGGGGQPRAAPSSGTAAVPATPRCAAPLRAQSAGRAEDTEALRQPDRRLSGPRSVAPQAESSIPPPATARPSQRTAQAGAVASRMATPRASSGEARTCREGPSNTTLRREASAGALTPTPGVGFKIEPPKLPKQVRQQRDRCQHWGPDPIAAEHLTVMKESWKCSVNDRLYRCMFSDRMEEQLIALQSWKHQVTSHVDTVLEVLDMLLKWLTWMLFNTNTQIWKLTLEVFGHLLDRLAEAEVQLTEREASILATNILERSGHNIQSVRENMMTILRQILVVYPRTKLLPLILAALASKNKRSAACAMRLLGDALDRQVAAILAKSHKDLGVVLKMIDDKDPDVRRAALQATASLSQHLDATAFDRIINFLPKSTQPIVRAAAAKLPPPPQTQPVMQAAAEPPSPALRRSVSATSTGLASPGKHLNHTPGKAPPRSSTPRQDSGQRWPVSHVAGSALQPPMHTDQAHTSSASTSPSGLESVPVVSLTQRLVQCSGEDFRTLCSTLKSRTRQLTDAEAVQLAEALVSSMRMYFGHDGCADRCTPLVELLDEFCATKECLRPLPTSLLRGLLKEQLRNLQYSGWTRRLENGAVILRTLNLSCVMLLNGICRQSAYSLLLELGTDESEAVHSSLVVKCLRKLNKTFNSSKNLDTEVMTALDVVKQWLERVHPRLLQTDGQERGMVESAAASLMDGVKEVVDAAKTASQQAARTWASHHEAAGEEARIVREWIINGTGSQSEKENQPVAAMGSPGPNDARKDGGCTPLKSRMSSPAVLGGTNSKGQPMAMDESHSLALESETTEEAAGWEIVPPRAAESERRRSRTSSRRAGSATRDATGATFGEDLVMGCLDPDCDTQFGEGSDRRSCQCCHLWFCERHLSQWPLFSTGRRPRSSSSSSDGAGLSGSFASAVINSSDNSLLESLGMPAGPGSMAVCAQCRATLALTPAPSRQSVMSWEAVPEAPCSEEDAMPAPGRLQAPGTDVQALAIEARALRELPLAALQAGTAAGEEPCRAVARGLLLRLLERLRLSLHPWPDPERQWLWRLREELTDVQPGWVAQFARQANWEVVKEANDVARLLERVHGRRSLAAREGLEVLGALGRHAQQAVAILGDRRLGLAATHAAEAMASLPPAELACCLELLLDAGTSLDACGATGGRRAVVGALLKAASAESVLRGELFWALEARTQAAVAHGQDAPSWPAVALEELQRGLQPEAELGLHRQRAWVRLLERGQADAARVEPSWGAPRAFPLAVWPLPKLCLGLEGRPREAASKSAPVILRCRYTLGPGQHGAATGSSGLLLKRDSGMHREQQVGQTLRLLEQFIWEDAGLRALLQDEGLELEDVRVTYTIAMTGPGTAIVEAVEGARTLRDIRAGSRSSFAGKQGTMLEFLRQHNGLRELPKALARLAFTAAVSAVLSFVAGLGDRHHENFMITVEGRLLHVDYGYALGQEPLDSMLIHYAVQGGRPATLLQYEELHEALGPELLKRIFWPVVRSAYLRVRRHAGLLAEMVYTAVMREPGTAVRPWTTAQAFVARHCATVMPEPCAAQFIHALLWYCARHERGSRLRDDLKRLRLRERTQQAVVSAYHRAVTSGRNASAAVGLTASEASDAFVGAAFGLLGGVRGLLLDAAGQEEARQAGG